MAFFPALYLYHQTKVAYIFLWSNSYREDGEVVLDGDSKDVSYIVKVISINCNVKYVVGVQHK